MTTDPAKSDVENRLISETFVGGAIGALRGPPPVPRLVPESVDQLERVPSLHWLGNLFPRSPLNLTRTYVQVSPCEERLAAGEVMVTPDASRRRVEISGELFTARPKPTSD